MKLFGGIFDFDKDGKTSLSEELVGLSAIGAIAGAAEAAEKAEAQEE